MGMDSVYRVSLILDLVDNMTERIHGPAQEVPEAVQKMSGAFGKMQKAGAVMTGIGTAITGACMGTVTATFDTQDALAEVASLGVKDLGTLEAAAKSFSDTYAGTTKADFISASYDIKSGIASLSDEGVAKYTEMAGLTAKATKATTDEMTSLFASGYGIYKTAYGDMSDLEFGEMFSAGIATAVKNYKTSGSQMSDAIKTMGASATNAKVPMEEQLAILGQLQATMSGSEAGTKYKAFINAAAGAGEKLGLSFTDNNNQLLGMTDIIGQLKSKYGDTIDAVEKQQIKDAFGTDEAVSLIDLLYQNTGQLQTGIEDLQTSMDGGIDTTKKMADTINDTPAQKFEVLKQSLHNAAEELGQGLLPGVNDTIEAVTKVVKKGSDWVSNHQELVGTIMRIVLGLGLFLIVAGTVTAVVGTLGKAMLTLKSVINILKTANLGLLKTMLASPITWVVIAILALVAAFKLCGGDADKFGQMINNAFGKIGNIASNLLTGLVNTLPQILIFGAQAIGMLATSIMTYAPQLLQSGMNLLGQLAQGILNALPQVLSIGLSIVMMLLQGFVSSLPQIVAGGVQLISMVVQGIQTAVPQLLSVAGQIIPMILQGILSALPQVLSGGIQLIGSLIAGIIQAAPTILSLPVQIFAEFINAILSIDWPTVGLQILTSIKDGIVGAAGGIWDAVKGVFTGGDTGNTDSAGKSLMDGVTTGIKSGESSATTAAGEAGTNIASAMNIDGSGAGAAGLNLMNGVTSGIQSGESSATSAAKSAGSSISSAMHVDVGGAGSAGSTLMNGLTSGISSGGSKAVAATKNVTKNVIMTIKNSSSAAGAAGKSLMTSVTNSVKDGGSKAVTAAKNAANKIKSAFQNIHVTVPRPRLPKINVSYSTVGSGGATAQVPHFSVSYFAKGGILNAATIFGMNGNDWMVGGESGKEAIIPLSELWTRMGDMLESAFNNVTAFLRTGETDSPLVKEKNEKTVSSIFEKGSAFFQKKTVEKSEVKEKGKQVFIENVNLELDVDDIDDINKLKKLIEQLEEDDD